MYALRYGEAMMGVESNSDAVHVRWGVRIPLRDGVHLTATVYLPRDRVAPSPVIATLTPYIAQTFHDRGMYFAGHGYPFVTVDVRGRGNSEGIFRPNINEAEDGHDVIEWIARQPYCDGQVAMWGGSYAGYAQWAAASRCPAHLAAIVPVAAPFFAVDFPIRNNIAKPYWLQWLMLVAGRASQERIFADARFWAERFRGWFESGQPFRRLDALLEMPFETFQEWTAHPHQDAYWDSYNPTAEQYARISIPILTITGIYDGDQAGALAHYRQHMKHGSDRACAQHYLVIGPWDHAGTRTPVQQFAGIRTGEASLVDLPKLHLQWYAWAMQCGPKPDFLRAPVAYYVLGAETWRYANTLEAVTERSEKLYLHSTSNPTDLGQSGTLVAQQPAQGRTDVYAYDPRDVSLAELESAVDPEDRSDHRMMHASSGRQLVYHSEPFAKDTQISGFFRLLVWLAIDQPDTDFLASVYEVARDGSVLHLTSDSIRARYRENLREQKLVCTQDPLPYVFDRFTFVAREVAEGSRLRLVVGPLHSIYSQKNYNSGGVVAEESVEDARPVIVRLVHDASHPSALYVPYGPPL